MALENAVDKPSDTSVDESFDKATLTSALVDASSKLAIIVFPYFKNICDFYTLKTFFRICTINSK